MATRNPEEKRRRLIDAGVEEFSERGLAGARLDRIARRADCSAGLLYSYFASKEALFDAVFGDIIAQVVEEVPITPDDLPGYAARLWQARADHPVEVRFLAWYGLERGDRGNVPELESADADKVAAVAEAQRRGVVDDSVPAREILDRVLALVYGYDPSSPDGADAVRRAVQLLVRPAVT
jgi:AcrR family transcriptional regulator